MTPLDIETALAWRGRTVVDRDGERIGTLKEIYLDDDERPSWGSVHTALFGLRETMVPLTEAQAEEDRLRLPYEAAHVKDAPSVDSDVQLTPDEEALLYDHYGLADPADAAAGTPAEEPSAAAEPSAAGGDDAMTRSEEELHVAGTRRRVVGRARLKKYVVTDWVEKTVPVRREEVRVEYEPADEGD